MEITISELIEKVNPTGDEWTVIDDPNDLDSNGKPKTRKVRFNVIPEYQSIAYLDLKDLVNGTDVNGNNPNLDRAIPGKWYLINDATPAEISLIVQAIAINKIHTDAKSTEFPQDVIKYDFEHDIIVWRWDTILDISVAQDLRNLIGLTIGSGCTNVHCGSGVLGQIKNNSTGIIVGKNSAVVLQGSYCEIGDNCDFQTDFLVNNIKIWNGIEVLGIVGDLQDINFRFSVDIVSASAIYNIEASKEVVKSTNGEARLTYINGSNVLVNVDAAA